MSTISQLMAVLGEDLEIPGLPNDRLISLSCSEGTILPDKLHPESLLKVYRLQTMKVLEMERGEFPEDETEAGIADFQEGGIKVTRAKSLLLYENSQRVIAMLNQLIIEIIRYEIFSEQELLDMEYYFDDKKRIIRRLIRESAIDYTES